MRIAAAALVVLALVGCSKERERARESPLAAVARQCDSEMGCPRPILTVRDFRASQRYYKEALGFKLDWDYGDPPDFGSVSRGDAMFFMCQGCDAPRGAWVWVFAHDVDRLHQELVEHEAIIKMPPTDMPWGLREMQVADPDGNVIRFAGEHDHQ